MNGSCTAITGTLGSGKTAKGVEIAVDRMQKGWWCCSNVEFLRDELKQRFAEDGLLFEDERLIDLGVEVKDYYLRIPRGNKDQQVLVIIDEAHLEHNARDWDKANKDLLTFVTLVRKLDVELIYITQVLTNVDKQIRAMVQFVWHCRNMKQLRILGVIPFPLPFYIRVPYTFVNGGQKPERIGAGEFIFRSPAWGLYKTDALLGAAAQKFLLLKTVEATPLKRIPRKAVKARPGDDFFVEVWAAISTFVIIICYNL